MLKRAATAIAVAITLAAAAAGCGRSGSSTPAASENSPPGDIPDNQAFVAFTAPGGGFSVKVPEGWSRRSAGGTATFTDKLNSIQVASAKAIAPLTVTGAKRGELAQLQRSVKGFQAGAVRPVRRPAGTGVLFTYLADAPADAVTAKSRQNAVERYVFFHRGTRVLLTLSGPKGADNVDPWRIVTDSLRWTK